MSLSIRSLLSTCAITIFIEARFKGADAKASVSDRLLVYPKSQSCYCLSKESHNNRISQNCPTHWFSYHSVQVSTVEGTTGSANHWSAVCMVITSTSTHGCLVLPNVWRRITKRTKSTKTLQWPYMHSLRIPVILYEFSIYSYTIGMLGIWAVYILY